MAQLHREENKKNHGEKGADGKAKDSELHNKNSPNLIRSEFLCGCNFT
jgi:hypothetical protein